jgi:hypothetical protein
MDMAVNIDIPHNCCSVVLESSGPKYHMTNSTNECAISIYTSDSTINIRSSTTRVLILSCNVPVDTNRYNIDIPELDSLIFSDITRPSIAVVNINFANIRLDQELPRVLLKGANIILAISFNERLFCYITEGNQYYADSLFYYFINDFLGNDVSKLEQHESGNYSTLKYDIYIGNRVLRFDLSKEDMFYEVVDNIDILIASKDELVRLIAN